jgi:light-regulated signal transduction histidine kinase (bacteriophytochrome)
MRPAVPPELEIENMRAQIATLEQLLAVHEKTALEQSRRLESILSSISDGFFVLDRNWRVTYLNPVAASTFAAMDVDGSDLLGRSLWARFPQLQHGELHQNCHRAMVDRVPSGFELYIDALSAHHEFHAYPWEDGVSVFFQDVTARKLAEHKREQIQEELERRVQIRTADLQATLAELEAFSYSVSHDLRAPLRSLDGFSQALLEDYEDKLEYDGKMYLERIRANAQKMAQLIDALLQLSRVTRSELNPVSVDLSAIVKQISADLSAANTARSCHFVIERGVTAEADPKLIEAALQNLLQNAWKFTSRCEKPRIEFGATIQRGVPACFIRDNGAGFDMRYGDKLFVAFQRLHDVRDFEGTGIGLATVSRIFKRHGGNIWAEGAPNKGATFYFTLRGLKSNSPEEKLA